MACALKARFLGPTWGPSGADSTQMGPMLVPLTLLSGFHFFIKTYQRADAVITSCEITLGTWIIKLRLKQNGQHFTDYTFRFIFVKKNVCTSFNMKFLSTVQLTKTLLEPGVTPYTCSCTLLSVNRNVVIIVTRSVSWLSMVLWYKEPGHQWA